ncbi:MAG: CocE/NonD family hydrolase [Aeromicrobium sp.]
MIRFRLLPVALVAVLGSTLTGTALRASATTTWTPRAEQYTSTVTTKDLAIPMSDGTVLRGDVTLPSADGKAPVAGRFPIVITITAYNKTVIAGGFGSTLAGADPAYLVKRGYAQLTVDARGTGSSEGSWCAFCSRENADATEIVNWAADQPWSDGTSAMTGASYMGISQIFAASGAPKGLKAIFPQVPAGDVYRDVVASGGQIDVGFIPLWLGLVTVTGIIPPAVGTSDPQSAFTALATHLTTLGTFTAPLLLSAAIGGEPAYDGPFYVQRSPINVVSHVDVPTFLVSGEFDLFQRGTPLLFQNLRKRGVPVKMIIGPWDHLQGSSGAEVSKAGYGTLAELQLRWFDHYVKGMPDESLDSDIPPVTFYEQGSGTWRTTKHWVGGDRTASTWKLSGNATMALLKGGLTQGTPAAGSATLLPVPVAGLCTRSASQWTAGAMTQVPLANPCLSDNSLNDNLGAVYDSAPLTTAAAFQGPINAHLFVSSTTGDGMLSVAVEDVAPGGKVARITGGWQVISLRKLDTHKSRYLDQQLIQPYHPFTKDSYAPLKGTEVAPVDVEIFPTAARILPGHRLRIAIQTFDVPHLLPNGTLAPGAAGVIALHIGGNTPSSVTVPALK